jgi:hypothetical protein
MREESSRGKGSARTVVVRPLIASKLGPYVVVALRTSAGITVVFWMVPLDSALISLAVIIMII